MRVDASKKFHDPPWIKYIYIIIYINIHINIYIYMNVPGEGVPSSTCQSHYVNIDNKKTVEIQTLCVCVCVSGILKCLNVLHMFYALKKNTGTHTHTHNTF